MKLLVCGTRGAKVTEKMVEDSFKFQNMSTLEIIEGCCPDSADELAERVAARFGLKVYHYPSHAGNYLKRNVEMVRACDAVLAFWDEYSHGTAHTIATATMHGKPVAIIKVKK